MNGDDGRVHVAGLALDAVDLDEAADRVLALAGEDRLHLVVTVNVDQALHVAENRHVAAVFQAASLRLADGAPVVALSRLLRRPLPARVTGADLLPAVCARAAVARARVALVGGGPGVPQEAARRLRARFPGLQVVLALSPPMGFDDDPVEDDQVVEAVAHAQPDIVFVCLGSPRQELWVGQRRERLPPAVYLGVGAAVDFAAGSVRRAPVALQRRGLEWAWRLSQDRRLARRYLVRGPRFLALSARALAARR